MEGFRSLHLLDFVPREQRPDGRLSSWTLDLSIPPSGGQQDPFSFHSYWNSYKKTIKTKFSFSPDLSKLYVRGKSMDVVLGVGHIGDLMGLSTQRWSKGPPSSIWCILLELYSLITGLNRPISSIIARFFATITKTFEEALQLAKLFLCFQEKTSVEEVSSFRKLGGGPRQRISMGVTVV
ncbi:hypothetical protein BCR34DRAFT_290626 [Clohesyomyces aquaticus]|uniref:Uncharacterized protein n=1 Tax=Clohesyomyces aquaticus TaxID=1231657 RepID=A0A1Y1ZR05_9PLEO|nr:hypothetical protein BCR34DRAFT_290626 [Clohesyomyces aquaticus]